MLSEENRKLVERYGVKSFMRFEPGHEILIADLNRLLDAARSEPKPYDESRCEDCSGVNPVWFAPNALWNLVMGGPEAKDDPGGTVCPVCFIKRAEGVGIEPTAWVLQPEPEPKPVPVSGGGELVKRLREAVASLKPLVVQSEDYVRRPAVRATEACIEAFSCLEALSRQQGVGDGWAIVPRDDNTRDFSDSLLPEAMIYAGMDALDRANQDLANYVPGETIDWDSGMIVVAVFRAMLSAAPPALDQGEASTS